MSKKVCTITYSTIDNQVTTKTVPMIDLSSNPGCLPMLNNIATYIETKKWPEEPVVNNLSSISWGLLPYQIIGTRCHTTQKHVLTESQHLFYSLILKTGVISPIVTKCFQNPDFEKLMLKEAYVRAKKRDETEVAKLIASHTPFYYSHSYRDALNRAKSRIQYHRNKERNCEDEYFDLCSVIEEFELYTIHSIQICS